MSAVRKLRKTDQEYPAVLREISGPPDQLYCVGPLAELMTLPRVAIVGTRKISPYGQEVTRELARQLAEQGIVIISGLAFGVDALAHRTALAAGGLAIAVLPSPIEQIAPRTNYWLAREIIAQGGALVSEYEDGMPPLRQHFIIRNRIVSGLADAVVIVEAGQKSGALYTADFGLKQGKDVFAVPGSIYSHTSVGTNNLIRTSQAGALMSYKDVLYALKLHSHQTAVQDVRGRNPKEQALLDLMLRGVNDGDQLLAQSGLSVPEYSQTITMLEIGGQIRSLGANNWGIY